MNKTILMVAMAITLWACDKNKNRQDASGTFEAVETIVSAEATGIIKQLTIEEGDLLSAGQKIGFIDSTQLFLKKKQLQGQINALLSKSPNVAKQIAALQEQLTQAVYEQKRVSNLLKSDAATTKQLDDANAQISIIKKQLAAQESSLEITTSSISQEVIPLKVQIEQLNDQLSKCTIINPIGGTVLTKYAEVNEMATVGKPLYKIADLYRITLYAYITGNQLAEIKLNQKIKVLVDWEGGKYREYEGIITWISSKAEFTPKTIQTKDERTNLVYAFKVSVKNDGYLKIGMYGEIKF